MFEKFGLIVFISFFGFLMGSLYSSSDMYSVIELTIIRWVSFVASWLGIILFIFSGNRK